MIETRIKSIQKRPDHSIVIRGGPLDGKHIVIDQNDAPPEKLRLETGTVRMHYQTWQRNESTRTQEWVEMEEYTTPSQYVYYRYDETLDCYEYQGGS